MSAPVDLIDTVPVKGQNTKTVEGRLMVTLRKLAVTEGNLHLLSSLKKRGLSTNDVTHFVVKQTLHKKVDREIDNKVRMSAMTSKIVDATAYAKRLRQEKNTIRSRVLKKYQGSKSKGKRIVDNMDKRYRDITI